MRRFRFIIFFLVLGLMFSTFAPSLAFAESSGGGDFDSDPGLFEPPWNTVVYGPNHSTDFGTDGDLGGTVKVEVGICAASRYDAAMVALGYDGVYISSLSSDVKAKLSNSSTGGQFWTFAQKFSNPTNDAMDLVQLYWMGLNALYGTGNVWRGTYTDYESNLANDDLHTILNGGSLGGGGGGASDFSFFDSDLPFMLGSDTTYKFHMTIGEQQAQYVRDDLSERPYISTIVFVTSGSGRTNYYPYCITCSKPFSYSTSGGNLQLVVDGAASIRLWGNDVVNFNANVTGGVWIFTANNFSRTNPVNIDGTYTFSRPYPFNSLYGYGNSEFQPSVPPSNWPSEPETTIPTSPDVPEPTEPERPVQPVQPTAPSLPDFPSNVISSGSSYETFDIQAILDAMDEHCQHLQSAIYQGFADYFDTFTPWLDERLETLQACIRGESVWQIQRIDADFESLKDYLHDLFEWLADQMQFTFTGDSYNDSTVVSWLRRIYFKLQSSPVNTRPADPVANPDGAWDWLWQLLQDILTGLTGGATELVGKLMNLFDGIKDKFPFSVPWDLAAVLALLDVPAQTPAFVVSYDVFGTTVTYDIDLHFMDEYAGVIRSMESVLFCFMLIKNTKWLTGIFDEVGQFLGAKLGYRG